MPTRFVRLLAYSRSRIVPQAPRRSTTGVPLCGPPIRLSPSVPPVPPTLKQKQGREAPTVVKNAFKGAEPEAHVPIQPQNPQAFTRTSMIHVKITAVR